MTTSDSRISPQGPPPPASSHSASARKKRRGGKSSQPAATVANPHARRRGGQPGNTNRLVHGYYSRRLPRQWTAPPNPRTGLHPEFEIALARVRLAGLLDAQQKAPRKHYLTYERLIMNYMGRIIALMQTAIKRRRVRPDLDLLLQELRLHPDPAVHLAAGIRTSFEPQLSTLQLPVSHP